MSFIKTLFLSLAFSFSAFANVEHELVAVSSDVDKEVGKMFYVMDEETGVLKHLYKDRYLNNKRIERVELNADDINGKGIVLHRKDKYVTVRLYSHNFDNERGGVLYLDTLYSGISGERREYTIEVQMYDEKAVMVHNKKEFNKMFFKAKRAPIVGPIGIERVTFSK